MKIIHLAYSDYIGGASIASTRIHNCLYKNNINSRLWVNEKDKGIYYAMNKGRKIVKGKWINFMNSGDTFYSKDTISSIPFTNFQNRSLVYGKTRLFSESKNL
jgi:hypothetical protein